VASVSRRHCEVAIDSDDELVVKDLKSSNGTFVNGERVARRELVPGDLLAIGPVVFVVRIDGHPKEIDPLESYVAGSVDLGEAAGAGGAGEAISGVPTWAGMSPKPRQAGNGAGDKPGKDDLDDGLSDLLADLDLGDDEDEEPPKKK
jgi:predicted component of type VI protein secretion system